MARGLPSAKFPLCLKPLVTPLHLIKPQVVLQIRASMCRASSSIYPTKNIVQLLLLRNIVIMLAFPLCKARMVNADVIFFILIFFNNVIQKSLIRLLLSTCANLYCSHAKQIRDLDETSKQKSFGHLATTELFPKGAQNNTETAK